MRKRALILGLFFLLVSIILTFVMDELAASYANLQPLAIVTLVLLVAGTITTGYSIWDEVTGRSSPKESPTYN